MVKVCSIRNAA